MGNRKLGRTSSQRKAMLRELTSDLLIHERIVTTQARASEVRSIAEKIITLGKLGNLHSRRQASSFIRNKISNIREEKDKLIMDNVLKKLFNDIAPRYKNHKGGYTRILKIGQRRGDAAPMVLLELV